MERLDRQLKEDRRLRGEEMSAAADRLDRQLAHDRDISAADTKAAGNRLDRQLAHGRELRDLDHLRMVLQAFVAETFDVKAASALRLGVNQAGTEEERKAALKAHVEAVTNRCIAINKQALSLTVVLGRDATLVKRLQSVAKALNDLVSEAEASIDKPVHDGDVENALSTAMSRYTTAIAEFLSCAYATVGWQYDGSKGPIPASITISDAVP
jgi:hypothetical protein